MSEWSLSEKIGAAGVVATIVGIFVSVLVAIPGVPEWVSNILNGFAPIWTDMREKYIGGDIVVNWKFGGANTAVFEIAHAHDYRFRIGLRSPIIEAYRKAVGESYSQRIEDVHNDTGFFRIRAVDPVDHKHALSRWSRTQRVAQYDSSYKRIVATHRIIIGVSFFDYHDDLFKWAKTNGSLDGIDIRLMNSIVPELSPLVGETLKLTSKIDYLAWPDILHAPAYGDADMVVAAISRRSDREREYNISFSEPYFCTTQAVIFRSSDGAGPIRQMISGRRVGFEEPSMSERLVTALAQDITANGGTAPERHPEARPAAIVDDLSNYKIDIGVTDLPFAVEAILTRGNKSLDYLSVDPSELPSSLSKENRFDEYAIAIRRGDPLLPLVNQSLRNLESSGVLASVVR